MIHANQPFGSLGAHEQSLLDTAGAVWATDINKHRDLVVKTYSPLVLQADNSGIEVERDVPYGSAERQRLDVYTRDEWRNESRNDSRDVLMFFHGGAFIRHRGSGRWRGLESRRRLPRCPSHSACP